MIGKSLGKGLRKKNSFCVRHQEDQVLPVDVFGVVPEETNNCCPRSRTKISWKLLEEAIAQRAESVLAGPRAAVSHVAAVLGSCPVRD